MRAARNRQKPFIIWFTGLSGSGKSTLAGQLELLLHEKGFRTFLLDGDNVRLGLNGDLGLSPADRRENIRRVGEVAKLFLDAGITVLCAFITPYEEERRALKKKFGERIAIIHLTTPLELCRQRDPKGLYADWQKGRIKGLTGLDAPFEHSESTDVQLDTSTITADEGARSLFERLFGQPHC